MPSFSARSRRRFLSASVASVAFAAFAASTLVSAVAVAAPKEVPLAEALFSSGKEAMARGDLATACERLGQSLKLDPAVGTRLNLAMCLERSGNPVEALELFATARAQLPKDDFRIAFATEHIEALTKRIGHVNVLPLRHSDGRVLIDGAEVRASEFGVPKAIALGTHSVTLERGGRVVSTSRITVTEGALVAVAPEADDGSPQTMPSSEPGRESGPPRATRTLGLVAGGVGVAGLATGVITGIVVLSSASRYKSDCTNGVCGSDGQDAAKTGRTMQIVSPVAFVVGALGLGASAYLLFGPPSKKPTATLAPSVSTAGASLGLSGSF